VTSPLESLKSEAFALAVEIARLQVLEHNLNDARAGMEEQADQLANRLGVGSVLPGNDANLAALMDAIRLNHADLDKTRTEIQDLRRQLDVIIVHIETLEEEFASNDDGDDDGEEGGNGEEDDDFLRRAHKKPGLN
jgi:chromosome segregation ATPase